jgi:uncharacterized protein
METSEQILLELRKSEKDLLTQFGVIKIALFGSFATDTATNQSDLDFLVEMSSPDFLRLMGLQAYLEAKFKRKVDLTRVGPHLTEKFFKKIESQLLYA